MNCKIYEKKFYEPHVDIQCHIIMFPSVTDIIGNSECIRCYRYIFAFSNCIVGCNVVNIKFCWFCNNISDYYLLAEG